MNGGKGRKGNKGGNNNKKKDEKKDDSNKETSKSKGPSFSSPLSFSEAWSSSFFLQSAVLLLTSLGFVVSSIPSLDNLPLGGRLRLCFQYWKKVCPNDWVLDVVAKGYKIPLRFVPFQ